MSLRAKLAAAIAAFTEVGGRLLAPAMPWLFLALRRALIATICWVILACFFFAVPQSRDVLHGLSEAPVRSLSEFEGEAAQLVNTWSMLSYVAMSTIIAVIVWYSARLLVAVDSRDATPRGLTEPPASTRLELAMIWLPRILGVSALAACIGALIYANYTPQLRQLPALALSIGAVAAPVLIAIAASMNESSRGKRIVLSSVGVAIYVTVAALLWIVETKWRVKVWAIASALLPAALLVFLVERRELFIRMKRDASGMSATDREFGNELVTILSMLAAGAIALVALAIAPTAAVRAFGSAATVLLFLASAVLLLTAAQLVLRRIAREVPGLTTAALIALALSIAISFQEPLGEERLPPGPPLAGAPGVAATAGGPRIYINAYGGGIRAAIFTAQVLAQADDATCGEFGNRIVAISGVSGGSLGIATYLVARQALIANGGWKACTSGAPGSTPLTDAVTKALVQDHLSPALARMLTVDVAPLPVSPKRGQALLDSWQSALMDALDGKAAPLPGLAVRMTELTGGIWPPPRVYFNATDADSGAIVSFSSGADGGFGQVFVEKPFELSELTVGEAVLHSARFPIVSPAGKFVTATRRRLVDGGYADNSGATALHWDWQPNPANDAVFVDIDGNAPEESICEKKDEIPPLPTAVGALLNARAAHALLAVKQFESDVGKPAQRLQLDLEKAYGVQPGAYASDACERVRRAQHAPLGWYVSYGAARIIIASAKFNVDALIPALGIARKQTLPTISVPK